MTDITVFMPVYNAELPILPEAVESIRRADLAGLDLPDRG